MEKAKKNHAAVMKKIVIEKGVEIPKQKAKELQKLPGGSNVGEYKRVSKKSFCGPSGGSPKGSFPVDTKKRCKSALSYAHNAPNPSGIAACVKKKCKDMISKFKKKKV
jgi:hypothetical protein